MATFGLYIYEKGIWNDNSSCSKAAIFLAHRLMMLWLIVPPDHQRPWIDQIWWTDTLGWKTVAGASNFVFFFNFPGHKCIIHVKWCQRGFGIGISHTILTHFRYNRTCQLLWIIKQIINSIHMLHPGIVGFNIAPRIGMFNPVSRDSPPGGCHGDWKNVFIIWFYNRKLGMIVECLVMNETILVFCLVIFRIWHYGKIPFTRAIRIKSKSVCQSFNGETQKASVFYRECFFFVVDATKS